MFGVWSVSFYREMLYDGNQMNEGKVNLENVMHDNALGIVFGTFGKVHVFLDILNDIVKVQVLDQVHHFLF